MFYRTKNKLFHISVEASLSLLAFDKSYNIDTHFLYSEPL